jgi:FAD/FMN-containing dehydrogenase
MDVKELQSRIEGKVTSATDAGYEHLRREMSWNQLTPARYPQLVAQVATEHDVVEAVRFARAHGMKVAVRGGGHSWVGFSLRDGGLVATEFGAVEGAKQTLERLNNYLTQM